MPDGLNRVLIIGNLGKDPELRYTANGNAVANATVAVGRTFGSGDQKREETEWFQVVAWEKQAEFLAQYAEKGHRVFVEGRLATRSWDGPDGQKRYRTEVVAEKVMLLSRSQKAPSPEGDISVYDLPFGDEY